MAQLLFSRQFGQKKITWQHFYVSDEEEIKINNVPQAVCESLVSDTARPRLTVNDDGFLLIFRGINFNEPDNHEDMVSVRIWCDAHQVISVEKRCVRSIRQLCDQIDSGRPLQTSIELVSSLLDNFIYKMDDIMDNLQDQIDILEDKVQSEGEKEIHRHDVIKIKQKIVLFLRHLRPKPQIFIDLLQLEKRLNWASGIDTYHLHTLRDHLLRHIENLETLYQRSQIIKDEINEQITDRMNRNTYVLSIVAFIFLPLGFLTGLFGINVMGIPLSETPWGFFIFSISLFMVMFLQIMILKWKKWF
jgi:zinc transporter